MKIKLNPLRKDKNKKCHKDSKTQNFHKELKFSTISLVYPYCPCVFPESRDKLWQKRAFRSGLKVLFAWLFFLEFLLSPMGWQ